MTDLIARLEELEKAATPGPWFVHANDLIGGWSVMNCDLPPSRADPKEGNYEVGDFMSGTSDSALIVELRNNLPAIIHALKVLEAAEGWRKSHRYLGWGASREAEEALVRAVKGEQP